MMRSNAKDKFESLNQPAKDLLTELVNTEVEDREWPEDHKPKLHPKKGTKHSRVAFDKRTRRYTSLDAAFSVPEVNIIKIDLGNNALHYCFHPTKQVYVRVQKPKDFQVKYVTLANAVHMI